MKRQPLHTRPDEEPDVDVDHMVAHDVWLDAADCRFCGQKGHRHAQCPNRPASGEL